MDTVRFRNDLPQSLNEPARCHSEVHKYFLLMSDPKWRPPDGELDEVLSLGVRMVSLAVGFDPSGATPLAPLPILTRVHGNSRLIGAEAAEVSSPKREK